MLALIDTDPGLDDALALLYAWNSPGLRLAALTTVAGQGGGEEHLFGTSPRYEDLRWDGLAFSREQFASVIGVDHAAWREELVLHAALFEQLAHHLPAPLLATKARLAARLEA